MAAGRPLLVASLLFASLLLASCSREAGPEARLKTYLDLRLSGGHGKEEIMGFLMGGMRDDIARMSPEEYRVFDAIGIRRLKAPRVVARRCRGGACFLTYTFKYSKRLFDSPAGGRGKDVEVEVKKVARLEQEGGQWKISAVDNTKSFVKFNKPIDVALQAPSDSPAGAADGPRPASEAPAGP